MTGVRFGVDIGFIGLGNMGTRIVSHMLDGGEHVTLWARRPASLEEFSGRADTAASPAEVGRASDVVGICVWDEHDVDEVLLGERGVLAGLRPGGIVAVHSTISPGACRRLHAEASERGAELVDVPVSLGSNAPKLLVMVGGEPVVVERCREAFATFADPVLHLGAVGSGQIAKLVNNTLLAATVGIANDAIGLGGELGLDEAALTAALSSGSSRGTWSGLLSMRRARTDQLSGRTSEWAGKDVGLTLDIAGEAGCDLDRDVLRLATRGAEFLA